MSNPTSNFGWQMPEPTDLVTDLPADFEVFGQAVDTDFVDLLGGTTGQVLSKTSNTDLDFTWIAANPGDITGVTAGTGISGGGTSGTVTVTNSMATEITAKADLIVGTGNATFDNLPVGTNGHILTADSTVSPTGLKWAAPAGGGKVLQVVSGTYSTQTVIASTSYSDTGLSLAITPTLNTSKVLVLITQNSGASRSVDDIGWTTKLLIGVTDLQELDNNLGNGDDGHWPNCFSYLDSPATTSSTTYKTQGKCSTTANSASAFYQIGGIMSTIVLLEIGA